MDPFDPHRGPVPKANSYRCGDQVWVWQSDKWHPGRVEGLGPTAVMVRYWHGRGQATDTVTPVYVTPRTEGQS